MSKDRVKLHRERMKARGYIRLEIWVHRDDRHRVMKLLEYLNQNRRKQGDL